MGKERERKPKPLMFLNKQRTFSDEAQKTCCSLELTKHSQISLSFSSPAHILHLPPL